MSTTRVAFAALAGILLVPSLLCAATIRDDFNGGFSSLLAWRWDVPRNDPVNTEDPTQYRFSSTSLDIGMLNGSLFLAQNNILNVPNVAILSDPGSTWAVETGVSVDWSTIPDRAGNFPQAGLIFFLDADNYATFIHNWNGSSGTDGAQVSTNCESPATNIFCGGDSDGIAPTPAFWRLRITGSPDEIEVFYDPGDGLFRPGRPLRPQFQDFLRNLQGLRVGLFTDDGGANPPPFPQSVASFDYFQVENLNVQLIPEPGTLALLVGGVVVFGLLRSRNALRR